MGVHEEISRKGDSQRCADIEKDDISHLKVRSERECKAQTDR